jgi:hypothetical protein
MISRYRRRESVMQIIELDASRWAGFEDMYAAFYHALGSPYSACNVNALLEAVYWDHVYDAFNGTDRCKGYSVKPPFTVRVLNHDKADPAVREQLAWLSEGLTEGHAWFRKERGGFDVDVALEMA